MPASDEFRIEIPIEVTNNADIGQLQRLESTLNRIYAIMQRDREASRSVFDEAANSANRAERAVDRLESAASGAARSFHEAGTAASQAGTEESHAADEARRATDRLGDAVDDTSRSFDETGASATEAGRRSSTAFDSASTSTDRFSQRVERSNRSIRDMFREKFELVLTAVDRASPILQSVWGSVRSLTGKAWNIAVRLTDFITAPIRKLMQLVANPITIMMSVAGIGMGARETIQTFRDFEVGMSAVRSLTRAGKEDFDALKQTAKDLGAATIFSASEASQGMQYLAMAGWEVNEIIAAMPGLLDLAAAGSTELGVAADIVSDVMQAMGMAAGEAGRAADVFAMTATSSNTTIETLGETMKYAAPIAKSFGMELEEVAAIAGIMGDAGIKGSQAGTAIRTALIRMADPAKDARDWMKKLGLSFSNTDGTMKSMSAILAETSAKFSTLSEEQRLSASQAIFGTMAASGWLAVIDRGSAAYDEFTAKLYGAKGAAAEMAEIRLDNLAGDLEELSGAIETAQLEIMEKFDPYMRAAVQWITTKIPGIQEKLEAMVEGIIQKAKELKEFFAGVFGSAEYINADGFAEKFFVAWDKVIVEPFNAWWNGGGKEAVLSRLATIGQTIGEFLHGIVTGIFAALTGREIDAGEMNITGIAEAGMEAAKTFVSSFAHGLNVGDMWDKAPGALKAGIAGAGLLKVGGGILGATRAIAYFRMAMGGAATAAAAAAPAVGAVGAEAAASAVGVGKAASALGLFKTVLAAVPGWGWVAAAIITGIAVGVKHYSDAMEQRRLELLHMGDAVEASARQWRETAQEVNQAQESIEEYKEVTANIDIARTGLTDEEIERLKGRLEEIETRRAELDIYLSATGLTQEQIQEYGSTLKSIEDQKAELDLQLAQGSTNTLLHAIGMLILSKEDLRVKAELIAWQSPASEKILPLVQEWYKYAAEKAKVEAELQAICNDPAKAEEVVALAERVDQLQAEKERIEKTIQLTAEADDETKAAIANIFKLHDISTEKQTVIAELNTICEDVEKAEKVYALMQQYAALPPEDRASVIAELETICEDPLQSALIKPLFDQYAALESTEATIKATLSTSQVGVDADRTIEQIKELAALYDEKSTIEFKLGLGEITDEQMAAYEQRQQELVDSIIESSNGLISQYDIENGRLGEKLAILEEQLALQREIARLELQAQVQEGRASLPEQIKQRDAYKQQYEHASELANQYDDKATELRKVQTEFGLLFAQIGAGEVEFGSDYYDKTIENLNTRWLRAGGSEGAWAAAGLTDAGAAAFQSSIDEMDAAEHRARKEQLQALGNITKQNESMIKQYMGEKSLIEMNAFKDTAFEGRTLEDLATEYNSMSVAQQMLFQEAIGQLEDLNKNAQYIEDANKTSTAEIWRTAYTSKEVVPENAPEIVAATVNAREAINTLKARNVQDAKTDTVFTQELKSNEEAYAKVLQLQKAIAEGGDTAKLLDYFNQRFGATYGTGDAATIEERVRLERQGIYNVQYETISNAYAGIGQIESQIETGEADLADMREKQARIQAAEDLANKYATEYGAMTPEQRAAHGASAAGAGQLAAINAELEALGIDKIESLSQLSEAMAALGSAKSEGAAAITALEESLAGLTADKIEGLVAIENALGTIEWNATNAGRLKQIPEALRISEADASRFATLARNIGNARERADELRRKLEDLDSSYNVSVNVRYTFKNSFNPSNLEGAAQSAEGGIFDGAFLSWVAEDGPEAIIPLGANRRDRGLDLWLQAGRELGVEAFADGGILAKYGSAVSDAYEGTGSTGSYGSATGISAGGIGGATVVIYADASQTYEIHGDSPEDIVAAIQAHADDVSEIIIGNVADKIEDALSNM